MRTTGDSLMKKLPTITLFTIRDKSDNSLIYAEGIDHDEFVSFFKIEQKWLDPEEITPGWQMRRDGTVSFSEEIRHINGTYNKIIINTDERYSFTDNYTLKKI